MIDIQRGCIKLGFPVYYSVAGIRDYVKGNPRGGALWQAERAKPEKTGL